MLYIYIQCSEINSYKVSHLTFFSTLAPVTYQSIVTLKTIIDVSQWLSELAMICFNKLTSPRQAVKPLLGNFPSLRIVRCHYLHDANL